MLIRAVITVISALLVAACATNADVQDLGEEISALELEVAVLAQQVTALEAAVTADAQDSETETVLQQLSADLDSLARSVGSARATTDGALLAATEALDRTDDIASCVNDYMDVIGRWSSNVNSRFTYLYC